jgi:uncharacterized membrane protein YeaQ/YmgE (transglycosylase-associated protein family)
MGSGLGILLWIIVGALTGWITALLTETAQPFGWPENVLAGIMGVLVGGLPLALLSGREDPLDWRLESFAMALVGALVLLTVLHRAPRA